MRLHRLNLKAWEKDCAPKTQNLYPDYPAVACGWDSITINTWQLSRLVRKLCRWFFMGHDGLFSLLPLFSLGVVSDFHHRPINDISYRSEPAVPARLAKLSSLFQINRTGYRLQLYLVWYRCLHAGHFVRRNHRWLVAQAALPQSKTDGRLMAIHFLSGRYVDWKLVFGRWTWTGSPRCKCARRVGRLIEIKHDVPCVIDLLCR